MTSTSDRHPDPIFDAQPSEYGPCSRINDSGSSPCVHIRVTLAFIDDHIPRSNGCSDHMGIVGESLVIVQEAADATGGPPGSALLAVFQIFALAGKLPVAIGAETLNSTGHWHSDEDAVIEETCSEGCFAQARAARHSSLRRVDLWYCGIDCVDCSTTP
jgi:hypothetical protein